MSVQTPARGSADRAGHRRPSGRAVLRNGWLPLVTVTALATGSVCIWHVHQMSEPGSVPSVPAAQAPEQFTPKRLTYELFGSIGDGGIVSYVDVSGHPHAIELAELPWSHTETTTLTVVSGSVSAQVDGGDLSCRMLVNDVVRDEHHSDHADADVTCRVKSA
ncbi:MAG: MmpS family transport accessory protein [Actinomycetota bacterium]|nr:MmpS family transport accessory protein [Actinomycetota bacterium]